MSKNWRLLEIKVDSYLEAGVSLRPAILRAKDEGLVPDTVLLTEYKHPSLAIQYYNDPFKDINLEACKECGINVGRAGTSGGGPIYSPSGPGEMGSGAIIFADRNSPLLPKSNEILLLSLIHRFADNLSSYYKLPIRYKPFNDAEIWEQESKTWKKLVAASVVGQKNAIMAAYATFIYPPDYNLINKLITPPAEKWSDKEVKSVFDRSTYLAKYLGGQFEMQSLKEITLRTVEKNFGVTLNPGELTEMELSFMEENRKRFLSLDWLLNRSEKKFNQPTGEIKKGEAIHKVPGGPLIRITAWREKGIIRDILFTGSIHASPLNCLVNLEEELKDLKIDEGLIKEKIEKMFAQGAQLPMIKTSDLLDTLLRALSV